MPWARYDDELPMNKKVAKLRALGVNGIAALGLHLLCNAWSRNQGTAGQIEAHIPEQLIGRPGRKLAGILAGVGMFDTNEGGWMIHDFHEYSDPHDPDPTRSAADRRREVSAKRAEAGRQGGYAKAGKQAGKSLALPEQTSGPVPDPVPDPVPVPCFSQVEDEKTPTNPGGGGNLLRRRMDIAAAYARMALSRANGVVNEGNWLTATRERILDDPDLARLSAKFPTAPPDVIAAALHGEMHSLGYFKTADEITPPRHLSIAGEPA